MPNLPPNLAKQSSKRGGGDSEPPVTKVVVVRDGPRSVRPSDEPSRFGVRTGFWASVGVGSMAFLWLTGHLGETIGFAQAIGVADLGTSSDGGLSTGVRMALAVPLRIYEMTMVDPMRLAAAFVLVSIPAAGLTVAEPRVPGGPRPSKLAATFATLGLIGASMVFAILLTWVSWPDRRATLGAAPGDRDLFSSWLADATATAGFDALALVAGVLWLVLLFRLPLHRAAFGLSSVAGFLAVFAAWTAFATSNGIVHGFTVDRPVVLGTSADGGQGLHIGSLHETPVLLSDGERPMALAEPDTRLVVTGRSSIADWMKPRQP